MSKKLDELINEGRTFSAAYRDTHMSSHLPMALTALSEMGASDEKLQNFYNSYSRILKKKEPATQTITNKNWKHTFGQHSLNADYVTFFEKEISQNGVKKTLQTYLPDLTPGISGSAFHPLIRLAYALDINHDGEVAEALAYWAMAHQTLETTGAGHTHKKKNIDTLLTELAQDKEVRDIEISGNNISKKMKSVNNGQAFQFYQNSLDITVDNLDDICEAVAHVFAQTRDFTILHGMTSASAMRKILPYLNSSEQNIALNHYGNALLTAYVTTGMPPVEKFTKDVPEKSWSEIFNQIIKSRSDHAIKVVYTCHQEDALNPQKTIYKRIATDLTFPKKP